MDKEQLKEILDKAKRGPFYLRRKDDKFVLLSEKSFLEMLDKIDCLQEALISELNKEKTYTADEARRNKKD